MGAFEDWMMTQQPQGPQPTDPNAVLATPQDSQPQSNTPVKSYITDMLKDVFDSAKQDGRIPTPTPTSTPPFVAPPTPNSGASLARSMGALGKVGLIGSGAAQTTAQPQNVASDELTNFLMQQQAPSQQPNNQQLSDFTNTLTQSQPTPRFDTSPQNLRAALQSQGGGGKMDALRGFLANITYNASQAGKKHVGLMTDPELAQNAANIADTRSQTQLRGAQTDLYRSESEQVPVQVGGETVMLPKKIAAGPLGKYITALNRTGQAPEPVSVNGIPVAIKAGGNTYAIGDPNMPAPLQPLAQAMIKAHQQKLQDDQNKPDTATQNKQRFQNAIGTITGEAGNRLDPGMVTDPKKIATAVANSTTLSDEDKRFALSYIAANPTPASQALNVVLRGEAYGGSKIYQQYDTQQKITRPVSADEINRANIEEPGRYTSPAYDPQVIAEKSVAKDLATGKTKDQVVSFNTFLGHLGDLHDGVAELRNTGVPWINTPWNVLKKNAEGDPGVSNFIARMEPVRKEYESFLLNNRALYDDDRKAGQGVINENMSPAQMDANIRQMAHTASIRLGAANDAYRRSSGGKEIPDLLNPEAQGVLNVFGEKIPNYRGATQPNTPSAPQGMISVQIPGQPPGHIPANARAKFLQDNPGAKVLP